MLLQSLFYYYQCQQLNKLFYQMQFDNGDQVQLIFKAQKQNQTGLSSNERLLMIKAGVISYFSSIPQQFINSIKAVQLSGQKPKFTIPADQIDQVELNGNNLSLLFKKSKLIDRSEFQRMVKDGEQLEKSRSITLKQQKNGYEKWIFKSNDMQMLKKFYTYVNLFRSKNPKFKPNLDAVLSSYQPQKKTRPRQLSINPYESKKMFSENQNRNRMSQTPVGGRQSFAQNILKQDTKASLFVNEPQKYQKIQLPQHVKEQKLKRQEQQRLNRVKHRIATINQPQLGIIDEKNDEDKLSQLSRNMERRKSVKIQIPTPFIPPIEETEEKQVEKEQDQAIKEEIVEKKQNTQPIQQFKDEEVIATNIQIPIIKQEVNEEKEVKEQIQQNIQTQPRPVSNKAQQVIIDINLSLSQSSVPLIQQSSIDLDQGKQRDYHAQIQIFPIKIVQQQPNPKNKIISPLKGSRSKLKMEKQKKAREETFNMSFNSSQSRFNEENQSKKKKKMKHFLKSSVTSKKNYPQISKKCGISLQDLQKFLNEQHKQQQQPCWSYIENTLSSLLTENKQTFSSILQRQNNNMVINEGLIDQYHNLLPEQESNANNFSPLDGQISLERYQPYKEEEYQALKWMEQKMGEGQTRYSSSKVLNNFNFKIQIRLLQFKLQNIICSKEGWILNRNGKLAEFLAYLRLQKVLKDINDKISNDIQLICGEAIYLRYKQYQGLAKQWRVGYPCVPLRSIKCLQFIHRCRDLNMFLEDFPQFSIMAEVIQQGQSYRLHLDRISKDSIDLPLQNQFKRIVFPLQNEIDIFQATPKFQIIKNKCLSQIDRVISAKNKITEADLYSLMEFMNANIEVDILCKLLGCRIDKKGQIYFHHRILRMGERQFGEEIALIRRSRKKGNIQFARVLSKKVMSRLQYYRNVTPMSNFIQIYLQLIDLIVVQQGELHKAIPILLKILGHLSEYQIEQFPVYLSLMRTFLKLKQLGNFVKILQNCRLFLNQMFKQNVLLFDYQFKKTIILLILKNDRQKALQLNDRLLQQLKKDTQLPQSIKQKFISKVYWDKSNLQLQLGRPYQSYLNCQQYLLVLEQNSNYYQQCWVQGVLCYCRSWIEMNQINATNAAEVQKRIQRALEFAFARQNTAIVFTLFNLAEKILQKCFELNLPCSLSSQFAFQQAQIIVNQTKAELIQYISNKQLVRN